jgi:hypothetical protein
MSQNPKPHFSPNFVANSEHSIKGLGEGQESINLLGWNSIPWATNCGEYDTTWGPCSYAKDNSGFVHLRGLFQCFLATASPPTAYVTPIFTLPRGFWPERYVMFLCAASYGIHEIQVDTAGICKFRPVKVGAYAGPGNWISLSGFYWYAPPQ